MSLHETQLWLESDTDYAENLNSLYSILASSLQQNPPRAILPGTFSTIANDLTAAQPVLQESLSMLPQWQAGEQPLQALLNSWSKLYFPTDCTAEPLDLPDTLEAAVTQIESIAGILTSAFLDAMTPEQATFIRNNHTQIINLLQPYPFGGGFDDVSRDIFIRYIDTMINTDLPAMFCAGLQWSRFLDSAWRNNLQALMAAHPRAGSGIIGQYFTPYGRVFFGGSANHNLLASDILFIADLGGDDIYALRTRDAWSGLPQMIMDFAGNDIYDALEPGGYAAGIGSVSLLTDFAGNDTYRALEQTQGFGLYGIGLLHDLAGNDEYIATAMAQGFGFFGVGLLLDQSGNDRYQVEGMGQGVGMTEGLGILADLEGSDNYAAIGLVPTSYGTPGLSDSWSQGIGVGVRYLTPGGVGFLDDRAGNDKYTAGSFAQGGGYYFGAGFFHDGGISSDTYLGSRYNFGWGAHMGIGYFREDGGDEHYRTRQIVAAGLAWDLSVTLFEDRSGNDIYEMGDFSLGASAHGSISLFHDFEGSDTYRNAVPARTNQGPPNLSLFQDTGDGDNVFEPPITEIECSHNAMLGLLIVTKILNRGILSACLPE